MELRNTILQKLIDDIEEKQDTLDPKAFEDANEKLSVGLKNYKESKSSIGEDKGKN